MKTFQFKALSKQRFNSATKREHVGRAERWLGFCMGPAIVASLYAGVGGSYLNSFYTDVLHLNALGAGLFLALMPVMSKILDAITNIFMGRLVDNTHSAQGKARPWILISGPIMAIAAILLFAVPTSNMLITAVWVICSYNLYFCIAYTMYNLSNVATIPLSTRDNKQRDTLAMASAIGINMVPGMILAVVFPSFILPFMGVDQNRWILVMSIMAFLAIPGTLIQYYFTRERITEEKMSDEEGQKKGISLPIALQVKGCLSSRYWLMIMIVMLLYQLYNNFSLISMLYYSNWVVGSYNDGRTLTLLNIIGQAMLGPGVLILWPLIRKLGKQKVYIIGSVIAVAGGVLGLLQAHNLSFALIALTIRSLGTLPITYVTLSMMADALDHVEWKSGIRCDGFSSSIYGIIITISAGVSTGIFNFGLAVTQYVAPASDGSYVTQSETVQRFFTFGMFGVPVVCSIILFVIFLLYDLEKKLPEIHSELNKRREAFKTEISEK